MRQLVATLVALVVTIGCVQDDERGGSTDSFSDAESIGTNFKGAMECSQRGLEWYTKGDYDKAIVDLNEAIRLNPKFPFTYSIRGDTWKKMGKYDMAIADYSEAIRLLPNSATSYSDRARAWEAKKEYGKAIVDFTEAIRLDPRYTFAYVSRGHAWQHKGNFDKAIADFDEVIRFEPESTMGYISRGRLYRDTGMYGEAIADFNEVVRLDPKNVYANIDLAWLRATCFNAIYCDGKKAVEYAKRAVESAEEERIRTGESENYYVAAYVAAAAHAETGNFEEAIEWQKKAIELSHGKNEQDRTDLRHYLERYRQGKPYRDEKD